jgi:hypothetical protein
MESTEIETGPVLWRFDLPGEEETAYEHGFPGQTVAAWAYSADEAWKEVRESDPRWWDEYASELDYDPRAGGRGYSLEAGDSDDLLRAAMASIMDQEHTLHYDEVQGHEVTFEDHASLAPLMNVAWMYYIADLVKRFDAPVEVVDRTSAFVAADWLFENIPPGTTDRRGRGLTSLNQKGYPTVNLLSDAVVDLAALDPQLPRGVGFVIEETADDGETWFMIERSRRWDHVPFRFATRREAQAWLARTRPTTRPEHDRWKAAMFSTPPLLRVLPEPTSVTSAVGRSQFAQPRRVEDSDWPWA